MLDHILIGILVVIILLALGGFGLVGSRLHRETRPVSRYNYKTDGEYAYIRSRSIEAGKRDQKNRWNDELEAINDHHERRKKVPFKRLRGETAASIDADKMREVRQTTKRFNMPERAARMGTQNPYTGEYKTGGIGRAGHGRRKHLRPDGTDATQKRKITASRSKPKPASESKWPRDTKYGGK